MAPQITVDILEPDAMTLVDSVPPEHVVDGSLQDMVTGDTIGELSVGLEWTGREALEVEGRVLRWNGTRDDFPVHTLITGNDQQTLTESKSSAPRQVTVRGRGLAAQWDFTRVGQWPGMEHDGVKYYTRHFNYASPRVSTQVIADQVYDHGLVLDYDSNGQPNQPDRPPPATWRAPTARRIGAQTFNLDVPNVTWLFRTSITTADKLILRQHATGDDWPLGWIQGVPVLKTDDRPAFVWGDTWASTTLLQADTDYSVVFRLDNAFTALGGSASWLAAAGWLLEFDSSPLSPSDLAYISQVTDWFALEIEEGDQTPGFTVPEILAILFAEFNAANSLQDWVVVDRSGLTELEFEQLEEVTFDTKRTTGLDVIRQFEQDGLAEFDVEVDVDNGYKQLICYPPGAMGNFHTSPASPPTPLGGEQMSLAHRWVDQ